METKYEIRWDGGLMARPATVADGFDLIDSWLEVDAENGDYIADEYVLYAVTNGRFRRVERP